jgi:trehalose/maltose transport system substrate-binding protein
VHGKSGASRQAARNTGVGRRLRRAAAVGLAAVVSTTVLAACGSDSGPPTLTWYINPDVGNLDASKGGQATLAAECTKASGGKYKIQVQLLPNSASDQREQLIRRLAAKDSSIDLMSMDPPFVAEAANAGFLAPISDSDAKLFTDGVLKGPVENVMWDGKLAAVPFWANTQLLWYRPSVAEKAGLDMSKPVTWDQIIDAAIKTHTTVEEQADRYEGYAVWINALIESAGGHVLADATAGADAKVTVDSPAGKAAAEVISKLANSPAANPALSTAEETESLAGFTGPNGGFVAIWPYIYADPSTQAMRDDKDLAWTRYPEVIAGKPSKPPLGGIALGVSAYSNHIDEAYDAAKCITSAEHQKEYMLKAGNPAAKGAVYDDPEVQKAFPMALLIRDSINSSAPRAVTPYYSDVSQALVQSFHPPSSVDPDTTPAKATAFITDVLQGKALL